MSPRPAVSASHSPRVPHSPVLRLYPSVDRLRKRRTVVTPAPARSSPSFSLVGLAALLLLGRQSPDPGDSSPDTPNDDASETEMSVQARADSLAQNALLVDDPIREKMNVHIDSMGWAETSRQGVTYEEMIRKDPPIGTVEDGVDHIDHAVDLVGVDHVGLGSDFDGVFAPAQGLQDASGYPTLVAELLRRG